MVCPAQGRVCSRCKEPTHFAKVCQKTERVRGREGQYWGRPELRQAQMAEESWESRQLRSLPPLEDIDDESVFMISCLKNR